MRIYVDKGAIAANEKLVKSTPIGDKFGIFKKLMPPIVIELFPGEEEKRVFEAEVLHAGEVVGKFVYDPMKPSGGTVWFEIHCAEIRTK